MPTSLVVGCLDVLLPVISQIINLSLSCRHFSEKWKEALVTPILKKPGLDPTQLNNLRPVSNLDFISKLTERAVFDQIHSHMSRFALYPTSQSAYRKGHSTETALLKVQNDILMNMNRKHVTLLVLLDLSAAFDTVDHNILLARLKSRIGINGTTLNWFTSYLNNRSQRVSLNGFTSDSFKLPYGVPQGSCLGPLLFTIYSSKLFEVIKCHLPEAHAYADDTQLYLSFSPDTATNHTDAVIAMERCISDIRTSMLIGTKQQLSKVNIDCLTVGSIDVVPVTVASNLGPWFDSNLNLQEQIQKTCKSGFFHLYNIRRIRKYLSQESARTLVHAFIIGRIDYCNSLLFGLSSAHLLKLQRLQNAAARLIFNVPRYSHITPVLCALHWLPVKFRIDFKYFFLLLKLSTVMHLVT